MTAPKTHYELSYVLQGQTVTAPSCGNHLIRSAILTTDPDKVTCKTCKKYADKMKELEEHDYPRRQS